ncbi:hypothetical protein [Pandoraea sp. PE-S2T-3]|uniref:hypothetical protein n=1 Tax=Pandoraea sp. PE-S2T-3 TaxID=1986993 RepID=UPI001124E9B8|nr:hypothetical protein [Pandoraea sp. PE-S2T-3]
MEVPTPTTRSMSSTDLRRAQGRRGESMPSQRPDQAASTARCLCDAMRDRWHADVTLHRDAIFLEACDGDVCVIRHTGGTRIERRMADVDDIRTTLALALNPALCRRAMVFGVAGKTLVLHGYVAAPMDFDARVAAIRRFLVVSTHIKREVLST